MATTVTKIIDPDNAGGTNYTSLDAWEDALGGTTNGDLVTYDEIALAQCRASSGSADAASIVVIDGWTTGASNYIKVEGYTGHKATAKWDTTKYRLFPSDTYDYGLAIVESYVRIDHLQLGNASGASTGGLIYTGAGHFYLTNCFINVSGSIASRCGIDMDGAGACTTYLINNVVWKSALGIFADYPTAGWCHVWYNNTVWGSYGIGIECRDGAGDGTFYLKNNISGGNGGADYTLSTFTTQSVLTNVDEDGSGDITGTPSFVNAAAGDFHLQSGDTVAKDAGTDLSTDGSGKYSFSTDSDDETRSDWDCGADEYVTAGGTDNLTASGIATGAPSVGGPTIAQTHILTASGVATAAPSVGAGTIGQVHALTATGIAAAAPSVGEPTLTVVVPLTATGLATAAPSVGAPTIAQVHVLAGTGIAPTAPSVGEPTIGQLHILTASGIATGAPSVGTPTIAMGIVDLSALGIACGAPSVGGPDIGQVHVLESVDLAAGEPSVGSPMLDYDPGEGGAWMSGRRRFLVFF